VRRLIAELNIAKQVRI